MGCSLNFLGFVVIIRLMYVYFISLNCWVVLIFGLGSAKEQDFGFFVGLCSNYKIYVCVFHDFEMLGCIS